MPEEKGVWRCAYRRNGTCLSMDARRHTLERGMRALEDALRDC